MNAQLTVTLALTTSLRKVGITKEKRRKINRKIVLEEIEKFGIVAEINLFRSI